jgi:Abortive infection C-terminus
VIQPDRVYGDPSKFRAALTDRVRWLAHLRDELRPLRGETSTRIAEPVVVESLTDSVNFWSPFEEFESRFSRWSHGLWKLLERHLGRERASQLFGAPSLGSTGRRRQRTPAAALADFDARLARADTVVASALALVNRSRRRVDAVAPAALRLDELRAAELVDPTVLDGYEQRVASLTTPRAQRDAFGAAKELLEAVFAAVLERLEEPQPTRQETFPDIAKRVRRALRARSGYSPEEGADALERIETSFANLESTLAELRNKYSWGHGRRRHPGGLRPRHARLALDVSETYVRFLVLSLDDLQLL